MSNLRKAIEVLSREVIDHGRIIEVGWLGLRMTMNEDAPQVQIDEMRSAFFAGAQHLWASILTVLESGTEASEKDLNRMTMIQSELDEFIRQYKLARGLHD